MAENEVFGSPKFLEVPRNLFSKRFLGGVTGQRPVGAMGQSPVRCPVTFPFFAKPVDKWENIGYNGNKKKGRLLY